MDPPQEVVDETTESVNPLDQSAFSPSDLTTNEYASIEALVKISQDMTRVLDRLTAPQAPSDSVRIHGAKEFHGSSMEESEKSKFWLEKLERVLEEVRYPLDQRASFVVSLLQGEAYDWWKLVLKSPRIPNPMTWEFFVQEFRAKYVTDMYRELKWK